MSLINTLKYHGRKAVLPVDEIKRISRSLLVGNRISEIVDFGAGTLFWSKWFADELGLNVIAVDTAYINNSLQYDLQNIVTQPDITKVFETLGNGMHKGRKAIFICDVIHHLQPDYWHSIFAQITEIFYVVIIKDIDADRKFGNFCNKMHDRIINGEKIQNVNLGEIEKHLINANFTIQTKALPKLWYPHFIITGVENNA